MTDLTLEQLALEILATVYEAECNPHLATVVRVGFYVPGIGTTLRAIKAALQQARQPGAQAVAWMEPHEGGVIGAVTKACEPWASVYTIPLYLAPPPSSLPDVSEQDVDICVEASDAAYHALPDDISEASGKVIVIRSVLETYRARHAKGGA